MCDNLFTLPTGIISGFSRVLAAKKGETVEKTRCIICTTELFYFFHFIFFLIKKFFLVYTMLFWFLP